MKDILVQNHKFKQIQRFISSCNEQLIIELGTEEIVEPTERKERGSRPTSGGGRRLLKAAGSHYRQTAIYVTPESDSQIIAEY